MSFDTKALEPLFESSRDAVVGIENGIIRFVNPAAASMLHCCVGANASDTFPEAVLSDPADRFQASCSIGGRPVVVSAVRMGSSALILIISCGEEKRPFSLPDRALLEFGSDLASAQQAIDNILAGDAGETTASALYRSLYRLRRLHRHLTLAAHIANDDLPCCPRPVDLRLSCGEICDSVHNTVHSLGYTVRFEARNAPCYAMADPDLFETMLLNILTNSLLYSEPGGEIRVSLSVHSGRCVIAVDDSGAGMSPEKLAGALHGCSPASLTDTKAGAGIGLFVARGIAEALDGSIILESHENRGTSIRVSIPAISSEGVEILSHPDEFRHIDGMKPILTELSVFLDRSFYRRNMMD